MLVDRISCDDEAKGASAQWSFDLSFLGWNIRKHPVLRFAADIASEKYLLRVVRDAASADREVYGADEEEEEEAEDGGGRAGQARGARNETEDGKEADQSAPYKDRQTYIAVQATKVTNNQRFVFTEALDSDFVQRSWLVLRLKKRLDDMLRSELPSFNLAPTILGPPLSEREAESIAGDAVSALGKGTSKLTTGFVVVIKTQPTSFLFNDGTNDEGG